MIRPVAEIAIAACGGAAAGAVVLLQDPTKEYGPLAVVVIVIGGMFAIAHRIAGIVDKRLGDLNATVTRQGEQLAELLQTWEALRRGFEDARVDRARLGDRFEALAARVDAHWDGQKPR